MADCKIQLIQDVANSLIGKMDRNNIELVSDEMAFKSVTDLC